jgi:hypothetical protein
VLTDAACLSAFDVIDSTSFNTHLGQLLSEQDCPVTFQLFTTADACADIMAVTHTADASHMSQCHVSFIDGGQIDGMQFPAMQALPHASK